MKKSSIDIRQLNAYLKTKSSHTIALKESSPTKSPLKFIRKGSRYNSSALLSQGSSPMKTQASTHYSVILPSELP